MPTGVLAGWWLKGVQGIKALGKTQGSPLSRIGTKASPGFSQHWNPGHYQKHNAGMGEISSSLFFLFLKGPCHREIDGGQ